jgi:hypothetical protein
MPNRAAVFVDTSGWIALLNTDDELHAAAREHLSGFAASRRPLVTTDWVLAETGNGLARTAARSRFVRAVRRFLESSSGRFVRIDASTFQAALDLYAQTSDKTWGLIDCASFVVMRSMNLADALTADRHFEQGGFRCLLAGGA